MSNEELDKKYVDIRLCFNCNREFIKSLSLFWFDGRQFCSNDCIYTYKLNELQAKKDITRLKNLLRKYRDHCITQYSNKNKNIDIVKVIEIIDISIDNIKYSL